jgi:hypothetical protein
MLNAQQTQRDALLLCNSPRTEKLVAVAVLVEACLVHIQLQLAPACVSDEMYVASACSIHIWHRAPASADNTVHERTCGKCWLLGYDPMVLVNGA